MDAYDGGANKQQIEILKMTWNLNTLLLHAKKSGSGSWEMEVGNPLETLEYHQSYEIWLIEKL